MHSVADVMAGLLLAAALLFPLIPLVEATDQFLLSSPLAPSVTLSLTLVAVWRYPGCDRWTPARADTVVVLASYLGSQLGNWANWQLGLLAAAPWPAPTPHPILWPSLRQYGLTLLRVLVGGAVSLVSRATVKPLSFRAACYLLQADSDALSKQEFHINNTKKLAADLFQKVNINTAILHCCRILLPVADLHRHWLHLLLSCSTLVPAAWL